MKAEYFIVLVISFIAPFILSFSRKIHFYKSPLRLILGIGIPFILFIIWDTIAATRGHWSFNPNYITGFKIFNLPVEEVLFFIIIPFCGLFSWECVKYFSRRKK